MRCRLLNPESAWFLPFSSGLEARLRERLSSYEVQIIKISAKSIGGAFSIVEAFPRTYVAGSAKRENSRTISIEPLDRTLQEVARAPCFALPTSASPVTPVVSLLPRCL